MFSPKLKKIIYTFLGVIVLLVGIVLTLYWPLIFFERPGWGRPKLYRVDDLRSIRRAAELAIVGGTLIDGNGGPPIENTAILIRNHRIAKIGKVGEFEIPPDTLQVPAAGKTILPGLIDMHVHLNKGDDLHLFLAAGVTTVRDVGNFINQVGTLDHATRSGEIIGPRIFYSGESFVHEYGFAPWQHRTGTGDEARQEVRNRISQGASVIKIVNDITPELTQVIVDEAHSSQIPVTADILGNGLLTADRAVLLGVDGLEHVSGVPQTIRLDSAPTQLPEPVSFLALFGWLYADKQKESTLIKLMVERGTFIVPTFVVMQAEFPKTVPVIADPASFYLSDRLQTFWTAFNRLPRFRSKANDAFLVHFMYSQQFIAQFLQAGGRVAAGSDEPTPNVVPGFSMHRELELLVEAGLTPMQAIQAATKTGDDFLGKSNELGTVESGKLADLIVVDGQPHVRVNDIRNVSTIIKDGMAFEKSDLLSLSRSK